MQRLEAETQRFQQEQKESRDQIVELLQKFGSEVKKVEDPRCKVEQTESIPDEWKAVGMDGEDEMPSQEIGHQPYKPESTATMTTVSTQSEMRISKPPTDLHLLWARASAERRGELRSVGVPSERCDGHAYRKFHESSHRKFLVRTGQRLSGIHWL